MYILPLLAGILLTIPLSGETQTNDNDRWIQYILERFAEELDEDEVENIILRLSAIHQNPFKIEIVTREQLFELPFLDAFAIDQIITWRDQFPDSLDFNHLKTRVSIDEIQMVLLTDFVVFQGESSLPVSRKAKLYTFDNRGSGRKILFTDNRLFVVSPEPRGYQGPNPYYVGNSMRYQERIQLRDDPLTMHFARSKQAGEVMKYPSVSGFHTFHARYRRTANTYPKNSLVPDDFLIGDYQAQFGQGLLLSRSSMSTGTRTLQRFGGSRSTFTPYQSASSGRFQRGAAARFRWKHNQLTLLYSNRSLSAAGDNIGNYYMPGWTVTRRTTAEEDRYKNLRLQSVGVFTLSQMQFRQSYIVLGGGFFHHSFDAAIIKRNGLHNRYDFQEKHLNQWTTTLSFRQQGLAYDAELASSLGHGSALIHGLQYSQRRVAIGVLHRSYDPDFHSLFGNAPGAWSGTSNESGTGAWLSIRPKTGQRIRIYADRFSSKEQRFSTLGPVSGYEYGMRLEQRISPSFWFYGEYNSKTAEISEEVADIYNRKRKVRSDRTSDTYKYSFRFEVSPALSFTSRIEYRRSIPITSNTDESNRPNEMHKGFGLSQFVRYRMKYLEFYAQHTIFETDLYETRIYTYEYDMIQSVRIPSFAGSGERSYLMIHAEPAHWIKIRIKYGRTLYTDRVAIGTGNDQTWGSKRNDITAQLRFDF